MRHGNNCVLFIIHTETQIVSNQCRRTSIQLDFGCQFVNYGFIICIHGDSSYMQFWEYLSLYVGINLPALSPWFIANHMRMKTNIILLFQIYRFIDP